MAHGENPWSALLVFCPYFDKQPRGCHMTVGNDKRIGMLAIVGVKAWQTTVAYSRLGKMAVKRVGCKQRTFNYICVQPPPPPPPTPPPSLVRSAGM